MSFCCEVEPCLPFLHLLFVLRMRFERPGCVRGHVVRRLTEDGTRYRAEWTRVVDVDHKRVLDLGDPFEADERWQEVALA